MKKIVCVLLSICVVAALGGCGRTPNTPTDPSTESTETLVVGTLNFDGKFSPFFYTNSYENDVISLVHFSLLGTDRDGAVVLKGIDGEVRNHNGTDYTYRGIADCTITENADGTVYYDFTLKDGVKFSDGTAVDIDDVIFSLYVPLDPSYDGIMTTYSMPIQGLSDYRENPEIPNISGIQKTSDMSMRIVLTEISATAIYDFVTAVVPLHYYGQEELYDYENNRFGFPKGDLSHVKSVTTKPMGGGPYKFVSFQGGTVTLEANEHYWKGKPKTKFIQFKEGQDADKVPGVVAGTLDIADPSYSVEMAKAIQNANGGEITGKVLTTHMVSNLGYGYIGMNAKNVCVNGAPGSDQSKNLRKAIATVIAVYRADMSAEEKYDAARQAALGFFRAAGYTVENGKVVSAPAGAAMSYEVLVGAGGTGDHPTFMALTLASEALKSIGFDLIVTDISNFSELSNAVNAGTAELFAMAWGASSDPDMYQVYHSQGSSNEKSYHLKDKQLDELILLARQSTDQAYRKLLYRQCLEIINDWAVEIPVYQRQNTVIFSTRRIDINTLTPDMTTFWGWENDIELLQLK